jgi:phage terminase large subunit-like protein
LPSGTRSSSPRSKLDPGDIAAAWIEASLVHGEGDLFGEPFRLTEDQRRFLRDLYRMQSGRRVVQRALLGRAKGWGKTELLAAVGLEQLCGPFAPAAPNVPIAAASFEQADLLFGTARVMVTEGPLKPYLEVFDTEILRRDGPGRMYRVAAVAGTNDGSRPTCFIADELHEWTGLKARVFLVISNSIAKRKDGLVLAISTAGSDDSELLRSMYDYGRRVRSNEVVDPHFLMDWAEADETLDPHDGPDVRRTMALQANPHAELFDMLEHIERRWHEIPEHEWRRYFANQWVTLAGESWLPTGAWGACRDDTIGFVDGADTWVGVDMALKHDSVAVVAGQWASDGRLVVRHQVWLPAGDTVDVAAVEAHLRLLHSQYRLVEVAYDPAFFARSAQTLEDDGLPMVEFPQSAQRMVPACQVAYELICGGKVAHDGSPVFADQVESAAPRMTDQGWRLSKGKSRRKIDAAVALVMMAARATQPVEAVESFFVY